MSTMLVRPASIPEHGHRSFDISEINANGGVRLATDRLHTLLPRARGSSEVSEPDGPMASVRVDAKKVHEFADEKSFYDWLARHHNKEDEVWIKIHKVSSGLASVTPKQAIDVALCWGWIDGLRKGLDTGKEMKIPDDLQSAIDADPKARKMLTSLSEQNRFALAFRVHNMKTAAGRQKKIEALVDMLKRGETIHPQRRK